MDPPLPPLPPINDNTVGSVNVAVELSDLDDSASAIAASVADDFFRSAFSESGGLQDRFLGEGSPDDNGKNTGESPASTSAPYQVGMLLDDVAAENEVLALGRRSSLFLKITITTKQNQNKDGYTYGHNSVPQPPPLEFDGANESQQPALQLLAVRFAPTNPPTQWTINEREINERMMNEQWTNDKHNTTQQPTRQWRWTTEQPNNERANNHERTMNKQWMNNNNEWTINGQR